jgi:hypothetical protein
MFMGKRKKRRERSKKKGKRSSAQTFVRVPHPFARIPHGALIDAFVKAGHSYADQFDRALSQLQALLASVDPMHVLSTLAGSSLFAGVDKSGTMHKRDESSSILQHHVELAQALALRLAEGQLTLVPARPDQIQQTSDLLLSVSKTFDGKRYSQVVHAQSQEEQAITLVQEHLRLNTHCVRNWGYFKPVVWILKELYAPLDSYFEEEVGLSATWLIHVFERLVTNVELGMNRHLGRLRPALQAGDLREVAVAYCEAFPQVKTRPEDLAEFFLTNAMSIESARLLCLTHATLFLPSLFVFSVDDVSEMAQVDRLALSQALPKLSLSFGDLSEHTPEHLFLDNPVWTKPLIRLDEDEYCAFLPQTFFSFGFRILDGLLDRSQPARRACQRRRADFLECEAERLIRLAFPNCLLGRNVVWEDGGTEYETDLVAGIDSYLIVVEAKSGAISWPALRGAPERAKRHIEELFIEPARQSERLATKLEGLISDGNENTVLRSLLPFDATHVREVVRLSVSLEDLASIQTNLTGLRETGWLPPDLQFPATMSLADLQVILDVLSSVPEKLHYLVRRAELEQNMRYMGDEIDLLGLYLTTAFNFAVLEFGDDAILLTGMSRPIDDYYEARDRGIEGKKPHIRSTKWWGDIRHQIERHAPTRWSEAAVMLLNVSYEDQQKLEKRFNKIAKQVRKSKRQPSYIDSVTLLPSVHRRDAFAVMAFRDRDRDKRHQKMENLASTVFDKSHVDRCLVVGVNVDRSEYPYSLLGVFDRLRDRMASKS